MMQQFTFLISLLVAINVTAQNDGYWDRQRATSREITVPAGNRVLLKTEDFPIGTTEVVYRITILDENQQLASSLVSLLKSIPDPSGISQGSAGAVYILSKVSGDDKCRYGIFNNLENAQKYRERGKPEKACLYQDTPINKEVKVLAAEKMACLGQNAQRLWFVFESNNWILKQKIVLEAVPWVDRKLSRGWNVENKKAVIALCKTSDLAKRIPDADEFCVCVLDKFQKQYTYTEYEKLLSVEKAKWFKDHGKHCLTETDASTEIYIALREQAVSLNHQGRHAEALSKFQLLVNEGRANASDYAEMGLAYIYTRQYQKAIKWLKEGEKLDASELIVQLNLAHANWFNGTASVAKKIYRKYQNQNLSATVGWKEQVLSDLESFSKAGLPDANFDKIRSIFER